MKLPVATEHGRPVVLVLVGMPAMALVGATFLLIPAVALLRGFLAPHEWAARSREILLILMSAALSGGVIAATCGYWLSSHIRMSFGRLTADSGRRSLLEEELRRVGKELLEVQAWSDQLLDATGVGIVCIDDQRKITLFGPGAERILGHSAEAALGLPCDDVFPRTEDDQPFSLSIPPPGQQQKMVLVPAEGGHVSLSITAARLFAPASGQTDTVLVLRDVSEGELVHRLLGEFLANVTHEFRTPLSALAASTELLLDQAPELSSAEVQELLNSLYLGIVSLQTLIDNLLESASMEAGRFRVHLRPSDLGQILSEASNMMRPLLEKHGQWLRLEIPETVPPVIGDARRLVQVLVNLLSNAIAYAPDNTEIRVGATVDNGWARVTVSDRGPGIPDAHRGNLFRRFARIISDEGKSRPGAGLGLFVVKAVVEAHGGCVGMEERPGGGSVFWFTLPEAAKP